MGLLKSSECMKWNDIKIIKELLKKNGVKQFIKVYDNSHINYKHEFIWGDELEFMICAPCKNLKKEDCSIQSEYLQSCNSKCDQMNYIRCNCDQNSNSYKNSDLNMLNTYECCCNKKECGYNKDCTGLNNEISKNVENGTVSTICDCGKGFFDENNGDIQKCNGDKRNENEDICENEVLSTVNSNFSLKRDFNQCMCFCNENGTKRRSLEKLDCSKQHLREEGKTSQRLLLCSEAILEKFKDSKMFLTVEFAAYMIETTPSHPHSSDFNLLLNVENCMNRRLEKVNYVLNELLPGAYVLLLPCFPKLGKYESFFDNLDLKNLKYDKPKDVIRGKGINNKIFQCNTEEKMEIMQNAAERGRVLHYNVTKSMFFPDNAITNHNRFRSFVRNIRFRRGRKVEGYIQEMVIDQNNDLDKKTLGDARMDSNESISAFKSKREEKVEGSDLGNHLQTDFKTNAKCFDENNESDIDERILDEEMLANLEKKVKGVIHPKKSVTITKILKEANEADDRLLNGHIKIDSMGQGMGCCCLQLTLQASSMNEARHIYDMIAAICPLLLRITRATPIGQGKLLNTETRWEMLSFSVDCRTNEERGCEYIISGPSEEDIKYFGLNQNKKGDIFSQEISTPEIRKSRFSSIDMYISEDASNLDEYNDIDAKLHSELYDLLINSNVDIKMAKHISSLFIRDPILVYSDDENLDILNKLKSQMVKEKELSQNNNKVESNDENDSGLCKKQNDSYKTKDTPDSNIHESNSCINSCMVKNISKSNYTESINITEEKILCSNHENEISPHPCSENCILKENNTQEPHNESALSSSSQIDETVKIPVENTESLTISSSLNCIGTDVDISMLTDNTIFTTSSDSGTTYKKFRTDDFENIQSSNWRSMRFKLPAQEGKIDKKGWKVEVRPMEIQPTAFENASWCIFVVLISRSIIKYKVNFYLPMSLVDENFRRANFLFNEYKDYKCPNSCTEKTKNIECTHVKIPKDKGKFFYRENIFEKGFSVVKEGTIEEIFLGSGEYIGIYGLVIKFIEEECQNKDNLKGILKYLQFIKGRFNGNILSVSDFIRKFVINHSEFKGSSLVPEKVLDDLLIKIGQVTKDNDVSYLNNKHDHT